MMQQHLLEGHHRRTQVRVTLAGRLSSETRRTYSSSPSINSKCFHRNSCRNRCLYYPSRGTSSCPRIINKNWSSSSPSLNQIAALCWRHFHRVSGNMMVGLKNSYLALNYNNKRVMERILRRRKTCRSKIWTRGPKSESDLLVSKVRR